MTKIIAEPRVHLVLPIPIWRQRRWKVRESERLGSESRNPGLDWSGNELTAEDVASADMVILTKDIASSLKSVLLARPSCASTSATGKTR